MHTDRHADDIRPLRVMIVDAHPVSLAACAALLRTEGLVVAQATPGDQVIEQLRGFQPDVVLIDPEPTAQCRDTAILVCSLRDAPLVIVTSTTERERLHPLVRQLPFLAKADVCADAIAQAVAAAVARDESRLSTGSQ